jgi:hypothetical protein
VKDLRWARLIFLKQDAEAAKALAFLLELPMDFLRVRVSPMVFVALISASVSGWEMESAKLSFDVCVWDLVLASAQESF